MTSVMTVVGMHQAIGKRNGNGDVLIPQALISHAAHEIILCSMVNSKMVPTPEEVIILLRQVI